MKQRGLVDRPSVQILNGDGTGGKQPLDVWNGQTGGSDHLGATRPSPDLDEMALARADRSGKQHHPRWPIGPGVD